MTDEATIALGPGARAYFHLCRGLGWLLRSAKYSAARIVSRDGVRQVRKRRAFYAPVLVGLGGPLMRMLDTGVRVLPQREWHEREQTLYRRLYGIPVRSDADGTLVLPCLAGQTLASLLEQQTSGDPVRRQAIALAAVALAAFHRLGFTHGDAMAENVLIDLEAGVARWVDFETVHEAHRPIGWRRADDVRALLVTCLVRIVPEKHAEIGQLIVDAYADPEVSRALAACFSSGRQRSLAFHLAQASLSVESFQELKRLFGLSCIPSHSVAGTARGTRPE